MKTRILFLILFVCGLPARSTHRQAASALRFSPRLAAVRPRRTLCRFFLSSSAASAAVASAGGRSAPGAAGFRLGNDYAMDDTSDSGPFLTGRGNGIQWRPALLHCPGEPEPRLHHRHGTAELLDHPGSAAHHDEHDDLHELRGRRMAARSMATRRPHLLHRCPGAAVAITELNLSNGRATGGARAAPARAAAAALAWAARSLWKMATSLSPG